MKAKLTILAGLLLTFFVSCTKDGRITNSHYFDTLVSNYSNTIETAPNKLSYSSITNEYKDSITNYLWANAPFINWEGVLINIETKNEMLFSRESTEILCLIKAKIGRKIEGIYLLSFYKSDNPLVYNNLKECAIGSNVYFGFEPWQLKENDQILHDILNYKFNMRGGLFYIGSAPQSYSSNAQRIVSLYDSLRAANPKEYIRIKDSVPSDFTKLPIEEQIFISEFSSFRNIYDEHYPRIKDIQ